MSAQDVVTIIDAICEKIGIAVNSFSDFVPMLAKREISISIYWIIISIITITASLLAMRYATKRAKQKMEDDKYHILDYDDFPSIWMAYGFGIITSIIFFVVLVTCMHDLISWISAPEVSAVKYILEILN